MERIDAIFREFSFALAILRNVVVNQSQDEAEKARLKGELSKQESREEASRRITLARDEITFNLAAYVLDIFEKYEMEIVDRAMAVCFDIEGNIEGNIEGTEC